MLSAEEREQQFIDGKGGVGQTIGNPASLGGPGRASKLKALGLTAGKGSRGMRFGVLTAGSRRVTTSAGECQAGKPLAVARAQTSL